MIYADEADMLNLILWGQTAKEWEEKNPQEVKKNFNNLRRKQIKFIQEIFAIPSRASSSAMSLYLLPE